MGGGRDGGEGGATAAAQADRQDEDEAALSEEREIKRIMKKVLADIQDSKQAETGAGTRRRDGASRPFRSHAVEAQVRVVEAKHKSIWKEDTANRQRDLEEKITGEPPGVETDLAGRTDAETKRLRRGSTLLASRVDGKPRAVVDPTYALSCIEALEKMARAERMTPIVGEVLQTACETLRLGLYGGGDSGVGASRNFYCIETGVLKREIEGLRQQCMRKQARVGSMKNEYVDLVNRFATVENDLEAILEQYHQTEIDREQGKTVVGVIQTQVDEEVRKQEQLAIAVEEQTKAVYRISQLLYEATNRRRDLRVDLRRARKRFETYRDEMELNKGTVAKEEFEAVLQDLSEMKDRIAVREAAMQMRQTAYMEVVHEIQHLSEDLRRERDEHAVKVQKDQELERSLTPRPSLSEALPLCKGMASNNQPPGGKSGSFSQRLQTSGSRRVLRRASSSVTEQAAGTDLRRGSSLVIKGANEDPSKPRLLRRGSSISSRINDEQQGTFKMRGKPLASKNSSESRGRLSRGATRSNLHKPGSGRGSRGGSRSESRSGNRGESRGESPSASANINEAQRPDFMAVVALASNAARGRGSGFKPAPPPTMSGPGVRRDERVKPTKEAVLEVAKEIARLGLDGPKLLQAHEKLRELQTALRDARSKLKIAESYVSMEMTLMQNKFLAMSGINARLHGPGPLTEGDKEWYERKMPLETSRRGELLVHALGRGPKVPQYLKHEGAVPLRMIPRGELRDLVHEVWNFKLVKEKSSAVGGAHVPLGDAFYHILKNRYGLQAVVAKWAYNVLYSLEQLKWDPDLELFRLALVHSIPEGTYIDQQVMLTALRSFLQKLSSIDMGGSLGEVSKETLFASLMNMFPHKKDHLMDELEECINVEQPMPLVFIDLLLETQDEQGHISSHAESFSAVVKRQHLEEIRDFHAALAEGLHVASLKYGDQNQCKLADLTQLMHKIDEPIQDAQLESFLRTAFPDRIHSHEEAQLARRMNKFPTRDVEQASAPAADSEAVTADSGAVTLLRGAASNELFEIDGMLESVRRSIFKPTSNFEIDPEPVIHT